MNMFESVKEWFLNLPRKKMIVIVFIAAVVVLAVANAVFAHDEAECACDDPPPPPPPTGELACLDGAFDGPTGTLKMLRIPVEFPGRITVGDLDHDGIP